MTSDPLREADQQSTLRLREAGAATSELATITVELQDDDQRAFEATMPVNMVAFATTQMTVRERDPAVQIDILRFNPDNTRLEIRYRLRDISATKGEDYFAPGNASNVFGPGQRNARLLIPLVQDTAFEDNEAFRVELLRDATEDGAEPEVFADTAIIIRDDDSCRLSVSLLDCSVADYEAMRWKKKNCGAIRASLLTVMSKHPVVPCCAPSGLPKTISIGHRSESHRPGR
jgi:hypothetical protein